MILNKREAIRTPAESAENARLKGLLRGAKRQARAYRVARRAAFRAMKKHRDSA